MARRSSNRMPLLLYNLKLASPRHTYRGFTCVKVISSDNMFKTRAFMTRENDESILILFLVLTHSTSQKRDAPWRHILGCQDHLSMPFLSWFSLAIIHIGLFITGQHNTELDPSQLKLCYPEIHGTSFTLEYTVLCSAGSLSLSRK